MEMMADGDVKTIDKKSIHNGGGESEQTSKGNIEMKKKMAKNKGLYLLRFIQELISNWSFLCVFLFVCCSQGISSLWFALLESSFLGPSSGCVFRTHFEL